MDKNLINSIISHRTTYGMREEIAAGNGYMLMWSNAAASWRRTIRCIKKGTIMHLDANQIFVPGSRKDIDSVINDLIALPLYCNSFEAQHR